MPPPNIIDYPTLMTINHQITNELQLKNKQDIIINKW